MTIEQTVEIPASHRLTLEVPPAIPEGKARIVYIPVEEAAPVRKSAAGLLSLRGSCEGMDTMDAYFERKRADKVREDEQIERQRKKSEQYRQDRQ
jgi:hypothetical protein